MSVNLIEMAKNYLTPDVVDKLAQSTGIDASQAKKTMAAAIPVVLAGVVQNATSEEGGGGGVLDLLKQKAFDGSMLGNLGSSLGGGGFSHILETGKSILSTLFGGRLDSILNLISGATGTSRTAATGLMAAAAPMVMNLIGKVKNEQGLSTGGLREMLGSQKDLIAKFAPPGLANAMGLANLGSLGEMAGQVKDRISGAADQMREGVGQVADRAYDTASSAYGSAARRVAGAAPKSDGAMRAVMIAAGCLAALAAILWWRHETPVAEAPKPGPVAVARERPAPPALQGQPISALIATTLPSGATLQLEPGSTAAGVIEFLKESAPGRPTQRFIVKEITFTQNEKTPTAGSSSALDRIAQALKEFPGSVARIHAYAPNGSSDMAARDLASQRAAQTRSALIDRGVAAERIKADEQAVSNPPRGVTEPRDTWIELEIVTVP
jgi:OmpA-OmpF porin, OOP family